LCACWRGGGECGMYRAPVWPQADNASSIAMPAGRANEGFTIRITV
jgi:hypothetical protein